MARQEDNDTKSPILISREAVFIPVLVTTCRDTIRIEKKGLL